MSTIWAVILVIGILTYLLRLSFILLQGHWQLPHAFQRGLRFVPVSVLTAIFIPELLMQEGSFYLALDNPRLVAGAAAILVAWRTKSPVWTIAAGMGVFWVVTGML
jgi:branched-subunit amino acid transport protein